MNFKLRLKDIFNIVFILVFLYVFKVSIFNATMFKNLNPILIICSLCILFALYLFFIKKINDLSFKKLIIINIILFIVILIIQIIVAKQLSVNPSWDFRYISSNAKIIALSQYCEDLNYYYTYYPNNLGSTIFLSLIYKFAIKIGISLDNYLVIGIIVNIVIINISMLLSCMLLWLFNGKTVATSFSFFIIFITPIYMYTPIFYTDTLSMIYPILLFLLYYLYRNKNKNIYLFLGVIFIAFGILIKANVAISLIGLFIYVFLTSRPKEYFKFILIAIVSITLVNTIFSLYLRNRYDFDIENKGFPATHWVMMGLSGHGGYNQEDVELTLYTNPDERMRMNLYVIKSRLLDYGMSGIINHLDEKVKFTWTDGTLYAPDKLRRDPIYPENKLAQYIYGEKNNQYLYLSQASFVILILGILLSSIKSLKNKNTIDIQNLFNITIFGVFLFLLIWETRSRYLVCFLPVMMMSSTIGVDYLYNIIFTKVKLIASKKRDD